MATMEWQGHQWTIYQGTGALGQCWDAEHVATNSLGRLVLSLGSGVAGGVSLRGQDKTYGTWTVRYRFTPGGGKYAILLWPQTTMRPEIDFAESPKNDPQRTTVTATLHPDMDTAHNVHAQKPGNFQIFHTLGVVWEPDLLSFTMDGKEWFKITQQVPTDPHHLCIQAESYSATDAAARLVIDKVSVT